LNLSHAFTGSYNQGYYKNAKSAAALVLVNPLIAQAAKYHMCSITSDIHLIVAT